MMEVNRIGGPVESTRVDMELRRKSQSESSAGTSQDALSISPEARMASNIVQFSEAIKDLPEVRQERVEQARKNVEEGNHRVTEVVRLVASRMSRYVINE